MLTVAGHQRIGAKCCFWMNPQCSNFLFGCNMFGYHLENDIMKSMLFQLKNTSQVKWFGGQRQQLEPTDSTFKLLEQLWMEKNMSKFCKKSYNCIWLFISAIFSCMMGPLPPEQSCKEVFGGEKYPTTGLAWKQYRPKLDWKFVDATEK